MQERLSCKTVISPKNKGKKSPGPPKKDPAPLLPLGQLLHQNKKRLALLLLFFWGGVSPSTPKRKAAGTLFFLFLFGGFLSGGKTPRPSLRLRGIGFAQHPGPVLRAGARQRSPPRNRGVGWPVSVGFWSPKRCLFKVSPSVCRFPREAQRGNVTYIGSLNMLFMFYESV